jgi:predicted nicotinamide N-methyase
VTMMSCYLQRTSACCRYIVGFQQHRRRRTAYDVVQREREFAKRCLSYAPAPATLPDESISSKDITTDNKYSKPLITDEGVKIFQADPTTASSGLGLTWGSVLWPSGSCLAKYLYWRHHQQQANANDDDADIINNNTRILELGCGTGVVGLNCAKLGARHVTLSDSASELWPILRKSIEANKINSDTINIYNLDWRDPSTFLNPSITNHHQDNRYDLVVAADVLYAGMDGLFARKSFIYHQVMKLIMDSINLPPLPLSPVHFERIRHSLISLVL